MDIRTKQQEINDPAEWDGSLFGSQLELVQLADGEFACQQFVTDLGSVQILRFSVNQPVKVRSRPLTHRYVAAFFDQAIEGHFAGAAITPWQMLLLPPAFDFDACAKEAGFRCTVLFADPDFLRSYYRTLVGRPLQEPAGLMTTHPEPAVTERLRAWPAWAASENLVALDNSQRDGVHGALVEEALSLFVDGLQAAIPFGRGDTPKQARAQSLVREAEDFANARPDQSVRMIELCQATGVSERTLQYAFQTTLGISPMSYLRRRRLHEVRRMLKAADPAASTVSAIACQAGFWHFSDFSQAYKELFDELPSETLRDIMPPGNSSGP